MLSLQVAVCFCWCPRMRIGATTVRRGGVKSLDLFLLCTACCGREVFLTGAGWRLDGGSCFVCWCVDLLCMCWASCAWRVSWCRDLGISRSLVSVGAYVRVHGISACAIRYAVRVLSTTQKKKWTARVFPRGSRIRAGRCVTLARDDVCFQLQVDNVTCLTGLHDRASR